MADVVAIVDAFKVNLAHSLVGAGQGLFKRGRGGGGTPRTRPPSVSSWPPTWEEPEWKISTPGIWRGGAEAGDGEACFIAAGIACGAGDDAG